MYVIPKDVPTFVDAERLIRAGRRDEAHRIWDLHEPHLTPQAFNRAIIDAVVLYDLLALTDDILDKARRPVSP